MSAVKKVLRKCSPSMVCDIFAVDLKTERRMRIGGKEFSSTLQDNDRPILSLNEEEPANAF